MNVMLCGYSIHHHNIVLLLKTYKDGLIGRHYENSFGKEGLFFNDVSHLNMSANDVFQKEQMQ